MMVRLNSSISDEKFSIPNRYFVSATSESQPAILSSMARKNRKDKKKKRREGAPLLTQYRPGSDISRDQLLYSLIGKVGSGYSGGHGSTNSGNQGFQNAFQGFSAEINKLGSLIADLAASNKKPHTAEMSINTDNNFGISVETDVAESKEDDDPSTMDTS